MITFLVPLLALAVPILDTALSIAAAPSLGAPIFRPIGCTCITACSTAEGSQRAAVLQFYFVTAALLLDRGLVHAARGVAAIVFLTGRDLLTLRLLAQSRRARSLARPASSGGRRSEACAR